KKDVVVDKAHLGANILVNTSTVPAVHVAFNTGTPKTGVIVTGTVEATNVFRQVDFDGAGGTFDNIFKFIPVISVLDDQGKLVAAGMVTPTPDLVAENAPKGQQVDAAVAAGDWPGFIALIRGMMPFKYEIRGVPANKTYTLVATTPNYPTLTKTVTVGAD